VVAHLLAKKGVVLGVRFARVKMNTIRKSMHSKKVHDTYNFAERTQFGDAANEMDSYKAEKLVRSIRGSCAPLTKANKLQIHHSARISSCLKTKLEKMKTAARLVSHREKSMQFKAAKHKANSKTNQSVSALIGVVTTTQTTEEKKLHSTRRCFVILPQSSFRRYWDMISLVLLTYTAFFTPFQIAFLGDSQRFDNIPEWAATFAVDRTVDLVFIIDLFLNFRSAWVTEEGFVVFDAQQAASQYFRSWFMIDFLSILPYDALNLLPSMSGDSAASLRFPKLLRLLRLMKIAKVVKASRIFKRWEQNISVKYGWIRLSSFLVLIVLISHWLACGLYLTHTIAVCIPTDWSDGPSDIPKHENTTISYCKPVLDTWVGTISDIPEGPGNVATKYTTSIYWAVMTLTTIGYGDLTAQNDEERWFFVLAMLTGAGFYAYAVGTMCAIVQGLDVNNLEFQATMDCVNEYMKVCDFPPKMRANVRRYMFYKRDSTMITGKEDQVLKLFSPSIAREVALVNYKTILHQVPQFQMMPVSFLADIALRLVPHVFGPNEYVFMQGHPADQLYILKNGSAQIERTKNQELYVLDTLHRNTYFGEYNLLYGTISDVSVRTLEFCDTSSLCKVNLDQILDRFPDMKRIVRHSFLKSLLRKRLLSGELQKLLNNANFMGEMTEIGSTGRIKSRRESGVYSARLLSESGLLNDGFSNENKSHNDKNSSSNSNSNSRDSALLQRLVSQMEIQGKQLAKINAAIGEMRSDIGEMKSNSNTQKSLPESLIMEAESLIMEA